MALVVSAEDDPDIRRLVELTLRRDHEVVTVADGRAGVRAAIDLLPDVVLLDIDMPVMNGLDACREIRNHPRTRHIPIVILTGSALSRLDDARHAGATLTLAKPFGPAELRRQVAAIAGHHHDSLADSGAVPGP